MRNTASNIIAILYITDHKIFMQDMRRHGVLALLICGEACDVGPLRVWLPVRYLHVYPGWEAWQCSNPVMCLVKRTTMTFSDAEQREYMDFQKCRRDYVVTKQREPMTEAEKTEAIGQSYSDRRSLKRKLEDEVAPIRKPTRQLKPYNRNKKAREASPSPVHLVKTPNHTVEVQEEIQVTDAATVHPSVDKCVVREPTTARSRPWLPQSKTVGQ